MFWDGSRWIDERVTTPKPVSRPKVRDWIATGIMVVVLGALVVPFSSTSARSLPGVRLMRAWSEDYSVKAYQETSDALRYHGRWRRAGHAAYLGDGARYTERRGASVQIRFRGTGASWVGPKGPTRGKAKVYLDGRLVKTVDSYAASFHPP